MTSASPFRRAALPTIGLLGTVALSLAGLSPASAAPATASIAGVVTDAATGAALSGVMVQLELPGASSLESTQTATDGSYSFTGLPAASYHIEFAANDNVHAQQWWSGASIIGSATPIHLGAAQVLTGINAALTDGGSISGTVTTPSGTPLADVGAMAEASDGTQLGYAETGSDGSYTIDGVAPGAVTVDFDGSDLIEQWWKNAPSFAKSTKFSIANGQHVTGINAALRSSVPQGTASISGTVTAAASGVLSTGAAQVEALDRAGDVLSIASIGANGSYTLTGLPAGKTTLEFMPGYDSTGANQWWNGASNFATATFFTVTAGAALSGYNATIQQGGTISGTVTDVNGAQLQAAYVQVFSATDTTANSAVGTANPDSTGAFSVGGLPAGNYLVEVTDGAPDTDIAQWWKGAATAKTATPIAVTAGQTVSGIDVVLKPGGTIVGTVSGRLANGALVTPPNAYYEVYDAAGTAVPQPNEVNPDGTYSITNLVPGIYTVEFFPQPDTTDFGSIWWKNAASEQTATKITVAAGQTRSGVNVVLPSTDVRAGEVQVLGSAKVGAVLAAATPGWGPSGVSLSYRWFSNGVPIAGATGPRYVVTAANAGARLSVTVTGSAAGLTSDSVTSAPTAPIAK